MKKKNKNNNISGNDKVETFLKKVFKILHLKLSEKIENLFIQIFKFGIVGVVATIIDFAFLYLFKEFCNFPIIVSNTLSFCISVVYNYWASVKWVFNVNEEKSKKKNFIVFIIFSVIGLLLNDLIMWITTDKLNIYYMVSKLIATLIVMVFNFITRKIFLE